MSRAPTPEADFAQASRVLYCIGAQKAGTTWLYRALRDHGQVHLSRIKEVHYWDTVLHPHVRFYAARAEAMVEALESASWPRRVAQHLLRDRAGRLADARRYRRMFREPDPRHLAYQRYLMAGWSGEPVVGDISPGYATMRADGFAAMDAAAPEARFVFILRDPVERLWSNVRHNRSRGFRADGAEPDAGAAFRRRLEEPQGGPFQRSDYRRTILELEAAVPRERIAYFFYETMFDEAEMARLAAFLGIAPIRADLGRRVNAGSQGEAPPDPDLMAAARARFAPVYDFAAERFGAALPERWRAGAAA